MRRTLGLFALLPLLAAPTCAQRFDPPSTARADSAAARTGAAPALHQRGAHQNAVETDAIAWHPTFNAALDAAKVSGKKVLVDVYAEWCPWCRRMQESTYPDASVYPEVGRHFEAVRLNAENDTDSLRYAYNGKTYSFTPASFVQALGVRGFPTVIFFGPDGTLLTSYPSYADAPTFRRIVRFLGTDAYKTQSFDAYEAPAGGAPGNGSGSAPGAAPDGASSTPAPASPSPAAPAGPAPAAPSVAPAR